MEYFWSGSVVSYLSVEDVDVIDFVLISYVYVIGIFLVLLLSCWELLWYVFERVWGSGVSIFFDLNLRLSFWNSEMEMWEIFNFMVF